MITHRRSFFGALAAALAAVVAVFHRKSARSGPGKSPRPPRWIGHN
jgi:hypothetical protein